jgi:hypothetical protein
MVLAEQALQAGMIDAIGVEQSAPQQSAPEAAAKKEVVSMDLETLKKDHPAVYAEAVAEERDRVTAHLEYGEDSGDLKTAFESIRNGSGLTQTVVAKYMTAARNKALTDARVEDNQDVTVEPEPQGGDSFETKVARELGKFTSDGEEGLIYE